MRAKKIIHTVLLALLVPTIMLAASGASLHIDSRLLWPLERLSSTKIDSLNEAADYVSKAAVLCGITSPNLMTDALESRLAAAELDAAKDPNKLVSDDHVAKAFNFMSEEFRVADPTRVTAEGISHYRGTMSAIWPHLFSAKSPNGSHAVGAVVTLYLLTFHGGMTGGLKKVGGPGGFGITEAEPDYPVPGTGKTSNLIALEYQNAAAAYFAERSPQQINSFLDHLAGILALPEGR